MAWAFATLVVDAQPLIDAVAAAARNRIDEFGQQNLANTLWAVSKRCVCNHPFLSSISSSASRMLDDLSP